MPRQMKSAPATPPCRCCTPPHSTSPSLHLRPPTLPCQTLTSPAPFAHAAAATAELGAATTMLLEGGVTVRAKKVSGTHGSAPRAGLGRSNNLNTPHHVHSSCSTAQQLHRGTAARAGAARLGQPKYVVLHHPPQRARALPRPRTTHHLPVPHFMLRRPRAGLLPRAIPPPLPHLHCMLAVPSLFAQH